MELIIPYFIIGIIRGCIWGAVTYTVNSHKGYTSNGFWWGFFLGLIGLIVVLCKPESYADYHASSSINKTHNNGSPRITAPKEIPINGWRCSCGRGNEAYMTSCICGKSKYDTRPDIQEVSVASTQKHEEETSSPSEERIIALLKEYNDLLKNGAITQEEYDTLKKKLIC